MRFTCFLCLLMASMAFGQAAPSSPPPASVKPPQEQPATQEGQANPSAANIPPDAPVITIKGLCDSKAPTATDKTCQTVITRAQFEKMADALQPNMPPAVRQRFANGYPRMLVMAREAEKRDLDKGAHFEALMQFVRLQVLDQELSRNLQEQAAQVSDIDIADYYRDNSPAFEQLTLQRIFVPRRKMVDASKENVKGKDVKATSQAKSGAGDAKADPQAQEQAAEEIMKKEADTLRGRAAAGEDFDKLQKEAYETAALKGSAPSTNIGKMRRTNLPPGHVAVFDLKPGEVSQVINDGSGYYIYKLQSKETLPLDQVKQEIHNTLQSQRLKDSMQALQQATSTELNDAYFGNSPTPSAPVPAKPNSGASIKEPAKTPPSQPK